MNTDNIEIYNGNEIEESLKNGIMKLHENNMKDIINLGEGYNKSLTYEDIFSSESRVVLYRENDNLNWFIMFRFDTEESMDDEYEYPVLYLLVSYVIIYMILLI